MPSSYLTAVGTAVPAHAVPQSTLLDVMQKLLLLSDPQEMRRLAALYRATGIAQRHTVVQDYTRIPPNFTWLPNSLLPADFPSVAERMALYRQEALPLAQRAVKNLAQKLSNQQLPALTHLITVSCTGMYAPGLDIELVHALGLPLHIQRTAINFMGCYGAFNALKVAQAICQSQAQAKVLVVSTELCTLHFQPDNSPDALLSAALFADGAAAALVEANPAAQGLSLEMGQGYTRLFPEGDADMAWHIGNQGFEMVLSSYIPQLLREGIGRFVAEMFGQEGQGAHDIDFWAIHPGGKEILNAVEAALHIPRTQNRWAHEVLKQYGNMSSATILFVLERLWDALTPADRGRKVLSMAFGPGLTVEAQAYTVV